MNIRTILNICPGEYWNKVDRAVKIRIENILYESVKSGKYDFINNKCIYGSLGTWIEKEHFLNFDGLDMWTGLIVSKIEADDSKEKSYIDTYLCGSICGANYNKINYSLERYFKSGFKNKDETIIKKLEEKIEFDQNHPWWEVFKEELNDYPEIVFIDFNF